MDAAKDCDFIFTCVGNDNDLREVTLGEKGLFKTAKKILFILIILLLQQILLENFIKKQKGKGFEFLDAPISGGQAGAEGGTLNCNGWR